MQNKKPEFIVWEAYFGNKSKAKDAFGREIRKDKYGKKDKYSWEMDHIWPENSEPNLKKGSNIYDNIQPLHFKSNESKKNKIQGKINGITFAITKKLQYKDKIVGKMQIKIDEKWYWAYDEPKY